MTITDDQVLASLRVWWGLGPDDPMPWDDKSVLDVLDFQGCSIRDMRAALEAAENVGRPC